MKSGAGSGSTGCYISLSSDLFLRVKPQPAAPTTEHMMRQHNVLQLRVDFTVSLEEIVQGRIGVIYKAISRWTKPCLHGKATITFLVVTQETSSELQRRLDPTFEQMGSVENHWCHIAPTSAVGKRGGDPFVHWLSIAWDKARQFDKTEHVRKPKVFRGVSKRSV